ncbi:hypothetical protein BgiBS90_038124, partial [Biomphalaria glabrata]
MESVQSRDQINKEINVKMEVEGETRRGLTEESLIREMEAVRSKNAGPDDKRRRHKMDDTDTLRLEKK